MDMVDHVHAHTHMIKQGRRRQLHNGQAACARALIKIRRAPKA